MIKLAEWPKQRLVALLSKDGIGPLEDRGRFEHFLEEECRPYGEESKCLMITYEEGIPGRLFRALAEESEQKAVARMSQTLHFKRGLHSDAAEWAILSWIEALRGIPTDTLNGWLHRVDPDAPRVPPGWGSTVRFSDEFLKDTNVDGEKEVAARRLDFGEVAAVETRSAEAPKTGDAGLSTDELLRAALRMARSDGCLTLEELDEFVAIGREKGVPEENLRKLLERVTLKGSFQDQLAGVLWYLLPKGRRSGLHVGLTIPAALRLAAESACEIPENETVAAIFASDQDGQGMVVLGESAVYWCDSPGTDGEDSSRIDYARLASCALAASEGDVLLGTTQRIDAEACGIAAEDLLRTLKALKGLVAWRLKHAAAV